MRFRHRILFKNTHYLMSSTVLVDYSKVVAEEKDGIECLSKYLHWVFYMVQNNCHIESVCVLFPKITKHEPFTDRIYKLPRNIDFTLHNIGA